MWYLEPVFGRIEPLRQRDNQRKIRDDAVLSACFWLLCTTSVAGPSVKQLFCLIFFLLFPSLLRSVWCFRSTSVFLCFYFFWGVATFPVISIRLHGRFVCTKLHLPNQKNQTGPRLQFIPGIDNHDNHRVQWLRNWLRVS